MERFIAEGKKESDAIGKIAEVFHVVEHSRFARITMRINTNYHSTALKSIKFGDDFLQQPHILLISPTLG
jgi:hypothetical protein